jgi:nucleotide-binding universal stress UspA family protein
MYRKILAPLDGSPLAECTIEHVKEIAKGCNIPEVVFLFVVDIAKNAYWAADVAPNVQILQQAEEAQKEGAQSYLKKVVAKAKKDGLMVKGVVVEGNPADSIIEYAQKNGVDLIVMSTHGRSGVSRFAMGSVTDKVIRTAAAPVLVVTPTECKVTR